MNEDPANPNPPAEWARWAELDRRLVEAARAIKVLSNLGWPAAVREKFLREWHEGNPTLPEPPRLALSFAEERGALERLIEDLQDDHPVIAYLRQTAESYRVAARMLESCGTPAFNELGGRLYGLPDQPLAGGPRTALDAAERFLAFSDRAGATCRLVEADYCLPAQVVADAFRERAAATFDGHQVNVEISSSLSSKAAAGSKRVRIRSTTCFSKEDIPQLIEHELFVHTLTALNGRQQPYLQSLGLGAPRTTLTQEGLAVLAEIITHSMDLTRLRRLALRPKAIQMALDGADFIEIFRFFVDSGQSELESYQSAFRIFRGGDVRGGVAFVKDGIYILGVVSVHNFLRKAFSENHVHLLHDLFAGRLALGDVTALGDYFRGGFIVPPRYEPEWVIDHHRLAAFLVYADFVHSLDLDDLTLSALTQPVDRRAES